MVERVWDKNQISELLDIFPVVAILGPRQCGKTTLSRLMNSDDAFDLENPLDRSRLEDPLLALDGKKGLVIIDEIQRAPGLFPVLRYLVDQDADRRFLILGSASRELVNRSSESLAGRIGYHALSGFRITDGDGLEVQKLWMRGGYPKSYLAKTDKSSRIWRDQFITTFLERDIPELGIRVPSGTLRKFWLMLSHYHAQSMNFAELGRSFGISDMTVRKYLDILAGTFMVRVLQPWHNNTGKRLVKNPKIYMRDAGLYHALLSVTTMDELTSHPKLGASWEGFALEQACLAIGLRDEEYFFWGTHGGAELDLFWQKGGKNYGAEFKYASAPSSTKSMQSAINDLCLERLFVIYPGDKTYAVTDKIKAFPVSSLKPGFEN